MGWTNGRLQMLTLQEIVRDSKDEFLEETRKKYLNVLPQAQNNFTENSHSPKNQSNASSK